MCVLINEYCLDRQYLFLSSRLLLLLPLCLLTPAALSVLIQPSSFFITSVVFVTF